MVGRWRKGYLELIFVTLGDFSHDYMIIVDINIWYNIYCKLNLLHWSNLGHRINMNWWLRLIRSASKFFILLYYRLYFDNNYCPAIIPMPVFKLLQFSQYFLITILSKLYSYIWVEKTCLRRNTQGLDGCVDNPISLRSVTRLTLEVANSHGNAIVHACA